ncbi:MAG: 23S rRNA pseudouridine(955/2504/2580) synthase [Gammaproteobacteria bacterium]|nr:23S rRNA pseudouridine(955/2504/2580) synthase [Gammaproteobacteria bacterium]
MPEVKKIIIDENISGQRLDNFLMNQLKGVPKSKVYSIIRKGEIRINSKRKKPSYKLINGDELRIPPIKVSKRENQFVSTNVIALIKDAIVEENDDYIALNKPVGIASHGGSGISIGVIETIRNFGKAYRDTKLVHRLDKDTSGCQIIAKNNKFLRRCNKLILERKIKKTYQSIVHGNWSHKDGIYEINIEKNMLIGKERMVRISDGGKIAKTFFKAIESSKHFSLIQCELITGRTHQLRVHLSDLGFPIVGDKKYGIKENKLPKDLDYKKRMYLHANSFISKDLNIHLNVKPPEEFKKILKNDE